MAGAAGGNLGFLTIVDEAAGIVGGYLVTNSWGRPLEFRLSSAVQPTRVQHILYGEALLPYLCGELIGKTLVEKTTAAAQVVFTDHPAALALRPQVAAPVGLVRSGRWDRGGLWHMVDDGLGCHVDFPEDSAALRTILKSGLDLNEPFERIREALGEARRLGVGTRAA